ncbi:MAG: THUMP domain-containing protein, partial [Desulfobacterales bacterium]|nr:THUMP domain-containing protein [Desulfobacterales bacterium]
MKPSAYDKRVKRRITGRKHPCFAACSPGLKQFGINEMTDLGFSVPDLTPMAGGIEFKARPEQIMNASLHLKTPLRILMRLARFKATSFSALEKK